MIAHLLICPFAHLPLAMAHEPIIPREAFRDKLLSNIAKRQSTLLIGDIGIGKTVLLKQVAQQFEVAIYLDAIFPFKSALLDILRVLHQRGDLHLDNVQVLASRFIGAEYLPWEDVQKKLARQNIKDLIGLIQNQLQGRDDVLFLNALETATPGLRRHIERLMEHATVVSATTHKRSSLKKLWWRFEALSLSPLTAKES